MGSGDSQSPQTHNSQTQSPNQPLGWGSNIQNARLARGAQLALQHGNYAEAFDDAQRATQSAPNDPQLWFLLGYAARLDHKYQASVDAYNHGLSIQPSAADGKSGLAQVYSEMGRTDDARRILQQLVASNPSRRDDLSLLGELSLKTKDYSGAADWLQEAERIRPDARSEVLLAICFEQLKQPDQASHYLEMAQHRAPGNVDVLRSAAGFYREIGKYPEAIDALKSIRKPKPDVVAELAYTYQLDGKYEDSARTYAQAANDEPGNLTLQVSAAQAEVAISSYSAADSFLNRAARLNANDYRLHAVKGEIAKLQDRTQDAVNEYTAALAAMPPNPVEGPLYGIQLHVDLIDLNKSLGDETAARQQLEIAENEINSVNSSGPDREPFLRLRSLIKLNAGDLNGALSDINEALALDRTNRDNLQLNGDILLKLGHADQAIATFKQILAGDPDNRMALTSLGYAYHAAKQDDDAEKCFEHLAQVEPASYVPYLALGDLDTARKQYNKAESFYSKAYALNPKDSAIVAGGMNAGIEAHQLPIAGKWLGRATNPMLGDPRLLREKERYLTFEGDYAASARVGRQAIKLMPKDRDAVVYLGYDLLHLGDYDGLLSLTTQYSSILRTEPDIPLLAGYVHKHNKQNDEALKDFTETINRDPSAVTAYVNRGYILNDLHRPRLAANDFETALKREPHNGEAHLGLAYADLDLHEPQAAIRQSKLAEEASGDSRDVHVIRATAYGRESMLSNAATEYRAALRFTPNDGSLHFGLGSTFFAEREYRQAIHELERAAALAPQSAEVDAMLARSYANLHDRGPTLRYVALAEEKAQHMLLANGAEGPKESDILISTGDALSTLGDDRAAMDRFSKALMMPSSDRVGVRLAIAQVMSQQDHNEDAERQIALGWMEAEAGDTAPPSGSQMIAAADIFRSMHDYQLSQTYLQRAKAAGAPDTEVRIGLADNDLALGDTVKAQAELSAIRDPQDGTENYQYLLAKATLLRQQQQGAQALTAFAQAADAAGEDQSAVQGMLETGANEGMRINPALSVLSDVTIEPIFEDSTVYVLDSKVDGPSPVATYEPGLLPPPRSSLQTLWTDAFHLHMGKWPPASGFFQLRNARGLISVPATSSIVNRNTTDSTLSFALNPSLHLGDNVITFSGGVQGTLRRDSLDPRDMNQNLFRVFAYMNTSSFFNAVSVSAYALRESGPFTQVTLHSRDLAAAVDFRVGAPWGKTAMITGWGVNDQVFRLTHIEDYYSSAYLGFEHRFSSRLNVSALAEYLRAWRIFGSRWGIAQDLRPAVTVDYAPARNWDVKFSSAYSNTRGFHVYDATQNGASVSYVRSLRHLFRSPSGDVNLQYPIRFSAGVQEEDFFNFTTAPNQQLRPYIEISIF